MIDPRSPDFADRPSHGTRWQQDYFGTRPSAAAPVVSILTPFFDTDAVFLETTACILGQSLAAWEWVIVDDGSTSVESLRMLDEVIATDSRIRLVRQANGGPAAARNRAFASSRAPFLCLLDSDDLVEPTYLEKCVWFLESQPGFAFCNAFSVIFGNEEYLWTTGFEQGRNHLHANSGPPISVLRRATFEVAGGFDETIRFGHEDWDFWLRIASKGLWGYTIPEYLQWYRKRSSGRFHQVMADPQRHEDFEKLMLSRYAGLLDDFPVARLRDGTPYEDVDVHIPFENRLERPDAAGTILFVLPWMVTGGADRVNLDWIDFLRRDRWRVTVCATLTSSHDWQHEFARLTPDVFVLNRFLHRTDYLRFLVYLIESRAIGTVVISGSTLGYLVLPYLRARCPGVAFVDLCHVEEPEWLNGGHPRFAVGYQEALHNNIVTTAHLRNWMTDRGADASRIDVCYTGAAIPDPCQPAQRTETRQRHGTTGDEPLIVFGGRLAPQKRPLVLLEILAQVAARGCAFRAVVVGDGELRQEVQNRCEALGLTSRVELTGSLAHADWLQLLEAADILLLPSAYEGISVALFEAMARGVVPVVGRVGGQTEVVDASCGALIASSDDEVAEYADAIVRYATDPDLRRMASGNARARIATRFSRDGGGTAFVTALRRAELRATTERTAMPLRLAHELSVQAFEYLRMTDLADFLWARRDQKAVDAAAIAPSIAVARGRLSRAGRLLLRFRVSRLGVWLARSPAVRMMGRRLLERLARRPGF